MKTMAEELSRHQDCVAGKNLGYYRTEYTCDCGGTFWAGIHEEDPSFAQANAAHQAAALSVAGFGPIQQARSESLRDAAEALELQPPKLRAQYVETLRLYAAEPWRLETCPSECAESHPGREHMARAANGPPHEP